jgi:hypothetical protein
VLSNDALDEIGVVSDNKEDDLDIANVSLKHHIFRTLFQIHRL